MANLIEGLVQGSPEWLAWRREGIGASEIAAVIGKCKYSTPYKVWSDKVGQAKAFEGNSATQRGNDLEGKARARYELLSMEDMPAALAVHPKYSIARASLDGLSADFKKILEIKCTSKESHLLALNEKKVPDHYWPQVQYQLLVTGAESCEYFSYYDLDPKIPVSAIVEVFPDVEYQAFLLVEALKFWDLVLSKTAPPLSDKDDKILTEGEAFEICQRLMNEDLHKKMIDQLKVKAIELGGHNRIRCGKVLLTKVVGASGKDVYRLTIAREKEEAA